MLYFAASLSEPRGNKQMHVVIVGAGIGGLALALMLKARGIKCQIYEAAPKIRELGVGINVLPHAIAELAELGLWLGSTRWRSAHAS